MELHGYSDATKCWAFHFTLIGIVRQWYQTLHPKTISTFKDLARTFISQFLVHKVHNKLAHHLSTIHQRENESTEAYLARFVKQEMLVEDRLDVIAQGALLTGLHNSNMKYLLSIAKPKSYLALIEEIWQHIYAK